MSLNLFADFCRCSAGWSQTTPAPQGRAREEASRRRRQASGSQPARPTAIIDTTAGKLTCTLFPDKAPIGVANFIGLAQGTKDWTNPISHAKKHGVPLYDGTIFHRVIPELHDPGWRSRRHRQRRYRFRVQERNFPDLKFDRPGRLAYANAGPGTNGSQFFITEVPYPSLNGGYTIFGQCDEPSIALVKQIARMGRDANDRPYRPVKITHIVIAKGGARRQPNHMQQPQPSLLRKSRRHLQPLQSSAGVSPAVARASCPRICKTKGPNAPSTRYLRHLRYF